MRQVIVSQENRQAVASSKILRGALPPADRVNGPVRMIEIEGVDINACGGYAPPHLLSLTTVKLCEWWSLSHGNKAGCKLCAQCSMNASILTCRANSASLVQNTPTFSIRDTGELGVLILHMTATRYCC